MSTLSRPLAHAFVLVLLLPVRWAAAQEAPSVRDSDAVAEGQGPYIPNHDDAPTAQAVRTTGQIVADGRLDEADWMTAPAVTDFWQFTPDEGAPVSERTEVRFLYDDDAIYVGAWLWDSDGVLATRLVRRDVALPDSDLFGVHFDSYHDHRTSYRLSITPSGSKRDLILSGGGGNGPGGISGGDTSWDPVWEGKTTVTDAGWFAEIRIPFSQLRFSSAEEQLWGMQLERNIQPQQEESSWIFTPSTEAGGVARFGHLVGIRGVEPGRRLEVLPYVAARAEYVGIEQNANVSFANPFRSGSDYFPATGVDLKYRLTSNVTLDATVNPDFGQVEVDPAVINLTAFETRFQERRPFFVEGADIFQFGVGGPQIVYSRRIGRPPQGGLPGASVYDDAPDVTTILGAAKVTGRTANGWSLGFLEAVTQRERASWLNASGTEGRYEVEPATNYLAARVRKDLRAGQTSVGALLTAVNRRVDGGPLEARLHASAYTGGIDLRHQWANRRWEVTAYFSPSYVTGDSAAIIRTQGAASRYYQRPDADYLGVDSTATSLFGYSTRVSVAKTAGAWRLSLAGAATSPGYEINDLGFSTDAGRMRADFGGGYERTRPGRYFRNWSLRVNSPIAFNYGGNKVQQAINFSANGQFPGFSSAGLTAQYVPPKMNDRLTRGGPLVREPEGYGGSVSYTTDTRRALSGRVSGGYDRERPGGHARDLSISLTWRASETVDVTLGPSLNESHVVAQYIAAVTDTLATPTYGRRYVFAGLDQTTFSLTARVNATLTPEISFELYMQPFISSADYGAIEELPAPRRSDFLEYGTDIGTIGPVGTGKFLIDPDGSGPAKSFQISDRDFNVRSLRGNAVFRWEWRAGSTLFLVWQQSRSGRIEGVDPGHPDRGGGDFDFGREARELLRVRPDNIFVVKVSYWLNP
ncbi:MAG: hypothetical protein EXR92_00245 [Gemmatimonadetes bacterium]|nr:hypothetical protein [Gemmatimonadota bacterium]